MKRLIVTIADDELVRVLSAIVKTGADFTVQNVDEAPPPVRHIQRKTPDGKRPSEIVLDKVIAQGRVSRQELAIALRDAGFAQNTIHGTASSLVREGLLIQEGDYYKAA
jgi:hypothetical protein